MHVHRVFQVLNFFTPSVPKDSCLPFNERTRWPDVRGRLLWERKGSFISWHDCVDLGWPMELEDLLIYLFIIVFWAVSLWQYWNLVLQKKGPAKVEPDTCRFVFRDFQWSWPVHSDHAQRIVGHLEAV
jgi:hypothetical protein